MSAKSRNHVKFDDANDGAISAKIMNVSKVQTNSKRAVEEESDSESDNDAPEEETVSQGKSLVEEEIKKREEIFKEEERLLKEKRRKADAFFKDQQKLKKHKESTVDYEEPLEELPEALLEKLEEDIETDRIETMPKHINFNEIDDEKYIPEIKQQLREKKKKTLKNLRAMSAKKGPVSVKVLSSAQLLSSMAPKREASVMNTKDKWLKRKALKRK